MTLAARIGKGTASRAVAARLAFRRAGGRTVLGAQFTPHPFHITRPFHIAGDPDGMATLYLQSSSGGLYGDDALSLQITAGEGAAAHVTSQASTVVHDARGGQSHQAVRLDLAAGALVEFCPDPLILFAGARLDARLEARLAPGARLILTDAALTHDPAGQGAPFDRYRSEIRIEDADGRPLLIDRASVEGADWAARTGGLPCHGSLIVAGLTDAAQMAAVASALSDALAGPAREGRHGGVSALGGRGVVLARFLASDGARLAGLLRAGWAAARRAMSGADPAPRRK